VEELASPGPGSILPVEAQVSPESAPGSIPAEELASPEPGSIGCCNFEL